LALRRSKTAALRSTPSWAGIEAARGEVACKQEPIDTLPEAQNCPQKRDQAGRGTWAGAASKAPQKALKDAS